MDRRDFLKVGLAASSAPCWTGLVHAKTGIDAAACERHQEKCDTFVYGSTPGGIAAAVQASRGGNRVILACPKRNPGGMAASGLCTTDAVRRQLFKGFVAEFIGKVRFHYRQLFAEDSQNWKLTSNGWYYEPSVAEQIFRNLLEAESDNLRWLPGYWLQSAKIAGGRIVEVTLETPEGKPVSVTAHTYIDGTYEGDLAAAADVPYRVGREGREEYGESLAGIHYRSLETGKQFMTPDTGEPSIAIQAFCCRCIMTDDPEHRVPIKKPETYEQHLQDYVPLLEDFRTRRLNSAMSVLHGSRQPRRKYQLNGKISGMTSINCPGVNWGYPEADRAHRESLDRFHQDHVAGMLYFLQHDPHLPDHVREEARQFGLHDEEFIDNDHWPWQLYVRQGRRIEGREIVTQHHFIADSKTGRTPRVSQPIALGEHPFDVHPCHDRRFAVKGLMEGVLASYPHKKTDWIARPGQIPYGAMVPKKLENLLVPVALSSTHVGMSVLRMEPVWMSTGQVAGFAAATALKSHIDVAQIDPVPLPKALGILTEPVQS